MRGSIRRRGANSFELRFSIDGKRLQRSFKGTYKEAQRELSRLLAAADQGSLPDPSNVSVAEYVLAYVETATQLSPKTGERYRELATRQIKPHLDVKLQKLRPEHIEQWHAALLAGGLAPRTVGHAHRLLSSALARAVENESVARNVAAIRKPPSVEPKEIAILSPDQIAAVLDGLRGHALYPIASLALGTGMRRGELACLALG